MKMRTVGILPLVLGLSLAVWLLGSGLVPRACSAELPEFTKNAIVTNLNRAQQTVGAVDHLGNWHLVALYRKGTGPDCTNCSLQYISNNGFKEIDNRTYCWNPGSGEFIENASLMIDIKGSVHIFYDVIDYATQKATVIHAVAPKNDGLILP